MTQDKQPRTVLVVEDNRYFRSLLGYAFEAAGFRTRLAGDGNQALEILAGELPGLDLVTLDLMLPGLNGFAILERLRAMPGGAAIKVIVVTGYGLNELEREILSQHGVLAVLGKSVPVERILSVARQALFPESGERRREERRPVSFAVIVRTPRSTHITNAYDLSVDGMFVAVPEEAPPSPGSDVRLKFWIPGSSEITEIEARVVWVNAAGEGLTGSHPPGFGVLFQGISDGTRQAIEELLPGQG